MAPKSNLKKHSSDKPKSPLTVARKNAKPVNLKFKPEASPIGTEKITNRSKTKPKPISDESQDVEIRKAVGDHRRLSEPRASVLFSNENEKALHEIRSQLKRLHENITAVLQYHQFVRQGNKPSNIKCINPKSCGVVATAQRTRPVRRVTINN